MNSTPTKKKWMKAHEYLKLFEMFLESKSSMQKYEHYNLGYCRKAGTPIHPDWLYIDPRECLYFLACDSLNGKGSFGFGKTIDKKQLKIKWKKNSFLNHAPYRNPTINYVTANGKSTDTEGEMKYYRMRIVKPIGLSTHCEDLPQVNWVLVHVRPVDGFNTRKKALSCVKKKVEPNVPNSLIVPDIGFQPSTQFKDCFKRKLVDIQPEVAEVDFAHAYESLDLLEAGTTSPIPFFDDLPDTDPARDFFNIVKATPKLEDNKFPGLPIQQHYKLKKTQPYVITL